MKDRTEPITGDSASRKTLVFCVVGMAFFWQLLRNRNYIELVPSSLRMLYLLIPCATFIALLMVMNLSNRARQRISDRRVVLVCAFIVSVLLAVLWVMERSGNNNGMVITVALIGMVVMPLVLLELVMSWARALKDLLRISDKFLVLCLLLSELLGLFISYLFFYPLSMPWLIVVISPTCSALSLLFVRTPDDRVNTEIHAEKTGNDQSSPRFLAFFSVLLVLSIIASGVISSNDSLVSGSYIWVKHIITGIELLVMIALFLFATNIETGTYLAWIGVTCILVLGLLLFAFIEQASSLWIGSSIISTSRSCLEVLLFMELLVGDFKDDAFGMPFFTGFLLPAMLGALLGYSAIPVVLRTLDVYDSQWISVFSLVTGFSLVICVIVVLTRIGLKSINGATSHSQPYGDGQMSESLQKAMLTLSIEHALTERETEMLQFVFKGYSLKKIAELEYLSINTVRSHAKSLYRKLEVHSRQEIIDLVEGKQRELMDK